MKAIDNCLELNRLFYLIVERASMIPIHIGLSLRMN
jgi:hypothetical protein